MKYPFFWTAFLMTAGVVVDRFCHPPLIYIFTGAVLTGPFLWQFRGSRKFLLFFGIMLIQLGILFSSLNHQLRPRGVEQWAKGQRVSLQGVVDTVPEVKITGKKQTFSFVLKSESVGFWNDEQYLIQECEGEVMCFLFNPAKEIQQGERIRLFGFLEPPKPADNPGQFDYAEYLNQQGIRTVFKAFGGKSVELLDRENVSVIKIWIEHVREWIRTQIGKRFSDSTRILLKALILGERKELNHDTREAFMRTGTSHLLAVSGLHISIISGIAYLFLIFTTKRQRLAAFLTLFVIVAYVILAGARIPVLRAGWMTGFVMLAVLIHRENNTLNALFFSYTLLLILDTRNLEQLSFQLSFLSVLSLIFVLRLGGKKPVWDSFSGTLSATAGTAPLIIYYFHVISLVAVFTNALAIPLFHLGILGGFLSLIFSPVPLAGSLLVCLTDWIFRISLAWIEWWNKPFWNALYLPHPEPWQFAAYYFFFGAILLMHYRWREKIPRWIKAFAWSGWLCVCLSFLVLNRPQGFELTLLSAGKNEMIYFQNGTSSKWLINTGRARPGYQAYWVIQPFLRFYGVQTLSGIILNGLGAKQTGGIPVLIKNFKLSHFLYPGSNKLHDWENGLRRHSKISTAAIRQAARVEGGKGMTIHLIPGGDKMAILIAGGKYEILIFPEMNEAVAAQIPARPPDKSRFRVAVIPAVREHEEQNVLSVLDRTSPDLVLSSFSNPEIQRILEERDIPFFDSHTLGALSFKIKENVSAPISHLSMVSFRKGVMKEWRI